MFFKQLVRLPYLYHSEELAIFIRHEPKTQNSDLVKVLSYMPKLNYQKYESIVKKYCQVEGEVN